MFLPDHVPTPLSNRFKLDSLKSYPVKATNWAKTGFVNMRDVEPSLGLPYTTNLIPYSQDFTKQFWYPGNASLSANNITAPDNTQTATLFTETPRSAIHDIAYFAIPITPGEIYTLSIYAKPNGRTLLNILFDNGVQNGITCVFDLSAGKSTTMSRNTSGIPLQSSMMYAGSGWWRCSITGEISPTEGMARTGFALATAFQQQWYATYSGNGLSGMYLWGAQLEKGLYTTDYIPTSGIKTNYISFDIPIASTTNRLSSYYFLVANAANDHYHSRTYTGDDSLFLKYNNLSYANNNPTFNFDISARLRSTSALFITLSTNAIGGEWGYFNGFSAININSNLSAVKNSNFNYLSCNNLFITHLSSVSTVYYYNHVPSICASYVFRNITWNLTAGGNLSAYNINARLFTPFLSAQTGFIKDLTANNAFVIKDINQSSPNIFYTNFSTNNFKTQWNTDRIGLSANVAIAPNGLKEAWKITEVVDTSNAQHLLYQPVVNINQGDTYTLSVFAKAAERNYLMLTAWGEAWGIFNLTTGSTSTISNQGNNVILSTQNIGNGWWRCVFTFTKSNTKPWVYIGTNTGSGSNSYQGDGKSGLYIWGAQLEKASSASPYSGYPTSLSLSANNYNGFIQVDPNYFSFNGYTLTSNVSSVYFFGVKPSDSHSTDDTTVLRTLNGAWDGSDGSTIETLPVCKPYFKNIRQVFNYVSDNGLYGEELNVLIYEDILQNNYNNNDTASSTGCSYNGNITGQFYSQQNVNTYVPKTLIDTGLQAGDYFWVADSTQPANGNIYYWGTGKISFENLNILGMYEIGSLINSNGKRQYTTQKPFNFSPRKISFRTYVCNNPNLPFGNFGSGNLDDWANVSTNAIYNRQVSFGSKQTDVTIKNLCFEFDGNTHDSTGLIFYSSHNYLVNVTIALKGQSRYPYGAVGVWPGATVYVCGEPQIDPYLLTPGTWNNWNQLSTATDRAYYPGYGLAIVGNEKYRNYPTLLDQFFDVWRGNLYIMDYNTNRRIGRRAYHNASIILDGNFNSFRFYIGQEKTKIYNINYIFRTSNFVLSSVYGTYLDASTYLNKFNFNQNYLNFNYYYYGGNYNRFQPHYFDLNTWTFSDSVALSGYYINNNQFTVNNHILQSGYTFLDSRTINLSGWLYDTFYVNSLAPSNGLNDNSYLYDYVGPYDLPLYNTAGFYKLPSPINNSFTYTLNYYSSGGQIISLKN